jgi:endonuclease G
MKKTILILIFILLGSETHASSSDFQYFIPEQAQGDQIVNKGYYMLSYSNIHEQPEWAYYKLERSMLSGKTRRMHYFRKDSEVEEKTPSMKDYSNSGYDRGHLVPAADMKMSYDSMKSTFVMSNVVPQKPEFNRNTWRFLETQVREFAYAKGSIYVITGPVLKKGLKRFSSEQISVPDSFYKILYKIYAGKIETISYLLPHDARGSNVKQYITTIDEIEYQTGIDFFRALPDWLEKRVESSISNGRWDH